MLTPHVLGFVLIYPSGDCLVVREDIRVSIMCNKCSFCSLIDPGVILNNSTYSVDGIVPAPIDKQADFMS